MTDYICACVMHADCDEEDSCWNMCHQTSGTGVDVEGIGTAHTHSSVNVSAMTRILG